MEQAKVQKNHIWDNKVKKKQLVDRLSDVH